MIIQSRQWFAIFLISIGVFMLVAVFTDFDAGTVFWPLAMMFLGIWFIFRPASSQERAFKLRMATDIYKKGEWQVKDEDIIAFAHDIDYDLTDADIPPGETQIQLTAFATELTVRMPEDVGLAVHTNAFVTESKLFGEKEEHIMMGFNYTSPDYDAAERKIRFEINSFSVDIIIF